MQNTASRERFGRATMESSDNILKQVCCSSYASRGCSKAQMCLKKIIDFITSHSSATLSYEMNFESQVNLVKKQEEVLSGGKLRFGIDLNLRLGPCLEGPELENGGFSACSGVGEDDSSRVCRITANCASSIVCFDGSTVYKSSEGECDPNSGEGRLLVVENGTKESSDITHLHVRSSEIEEDGQKSNIKAGKRKYEQITVEEDEQSKLSRRTKHRSEGYLDLLVEAARVISGSIDDDDAIPERKKPSQTDLLETQSITKPPRLEFDGNEKWIFEDDISPIVRSKRGRNQALPCRYRDSVIEPLKKDRGAKQRSSRFSTKSRKK